MQFGGCRTIVYYVREPVEAARWFEQELGARLLYADDDWVALRLFDGGPRIGLHRSDEPGGVTAFYQVADIETTLRQLTAAGCTVEHPLTDLEEVRIASVRTPAGIVLGLEEPKAQG